MDAVRTDPSVRVANALLIWIFVLLVDVFQAPHLAVNHLALLRQELVWLGDILPADVEAFDLDALRVSHWDVIPCDLGQLVAI